MVNERREESGRGFERCLVRRVRITKTRQKAGKYTNEPAALTKRQRKNNKRRKRRSDEDWQEAED